MAIVPPTKENIAQGAEIIRSGELVAFPTETVYGLGADATNESAVRKIFLVKGRPNNNPLIVHVSSVADLSKVTDLGAHPQVASRIEKLSCLWPGPLSVVLPKSASISQSVCGAGSNTVAVRIPNNFVALEFLRACKRPIAAPSANISGYISPTTAVHVQNSLGDRVSMILDGGSCEYGLESTVVSVTEQIPVLLRPGAISREIIAQILGEPVSSVATFNEGGQTFPSPGLLLKHYAPRTPTVFARGGPPFPANIKIGALWFSTDPIPCTCKKALILSESRDPDEIAPKLYAGLHELDNSGLDLIILDECDPIGTGEAVMDRLRRATQR